MIDFFKFYYLPIISGLLLGLSYIPFPPWALFFGFVPLWHFCLKHHLRVKSLILGAWICQFTFSLVGFHWVIYTVQVYGQMNMFVSGVIFLLFCSFAHLHIPIATFIWSLFIRLKFFSKEWAQWLLLPTITALCLSWIPMLFQWNFGYPWLWARLPAFHTAEIWGFQFLSSLTLLFQLIFLSVRKRDLFKKLFPIGFVLFLFLNVFGYFLHQMQPKEDKQASVLMVQHNIGNYIEYSGRIEGAFHKTVQRLMALSQAQLKNNKADFIVWPEGAYPYLISKKRLPFQYEALKHRVRRYLKTPLVTGGTSVTPKGLTNSIFFLNEKGEFSSKRYDKNYLLAFGEFIPGDHWFPSLRKFFLGSHRAMIPGTEGASVRHVAGVNLGLQICYEGLRPHYSRELVQKNTQILVNVTNDSWFGKWSQPDQHLYLTMARSIETRTPMVRLSTVGYSAVMQADGTFFKSPLHQEWAHVASVPYFSQPRKTIFVRWGHWINSIVLIVLLILPIFLSFIKPSRPYSNFK